MKHHELPRVLRRAVGLMRFAREAVDADAASMFLLRGGNVLHGVVSEWDWTRTSFASDVGEWPGVAAALSDGVPRWISADEARDGEVDWFGARGIARTLCVPLGAGASSRGVLFFDFESTIASIDARHTRLLADVGRRCLRAFTRPAPRLARAELATWH